MGDTAGAGDPEHVQPLEITAASIFGKQAAGNRLSVTGRENRDKRMPPPIKVELVPHSPAWALAAKEESFRLAQAFDGAVLDVHHIGSTAIPGIHAKPVIDLLPVVRSVTDLDAKQPVFLGLGYQYWGEYGIPGRRYCSFDDPLSGRRKFQLHCFEPESDQIERHLAFRDYLRANPTVRRESTTKKSTAAANYILTIHTRIPTRRPHGSPRNCRLRLLYFTAASR